MKVKNYNEIKLELDFLTNSNIRTNSINVPEWEFKKREKEKKTKSYLNLEKFDAIILKVEKYYGKNIPLTLSSLFFNLHLEYLSENKSEVEKITVAQKILDISNTKVEYKPSPMREHENSGEIVLWDGSIDPFINQSNQNAFNGSKDSLWVWALLSMKTIKVTRN